MKQSVRQVQPRNIENRDRHARRASADLLVRARQQVLDRTAHVPTPFEGFDDRGYTAGSNNSAILVTNSQHQIGALSARCANERLRNTLIYQCNSPSVRFREDSAMTPIRGVA